MRQCNPTYLTSFSISDIYLQFSSFDLALTRAQLFQLRPFIVKGNTCTSIHHFSWYPFWIFKLISIIQPVNICTVPEPAWKRLLAFQISTDVEFIFFYDVSNENFYLKWQQSCRMSTKMFSLTECEMMDTALENGLCLSSKVWVYLQQTRCKGVHWRRKGMAVFSFQLQFTF